MVSGHWPFYIKKSMEQAAAHPIGVFDSGYGGLTVLKEVVERLPGYDYLYLGDNSRAPYGSRSFETVYHYTLQCVQWLFAQGCPLVILACNTASAKALRTIQQNDLPVMAPDNRVLGVIRPTSEIIGTFTTSGQVGIMATQGTVNSGSYLLEIEKFFPEVQVAQQACPMLVPLVENNEYEGAGADFFIEKYVNQLLKQKPGIDTVLLACTHYPLLATKIQQYLPETVQLVSQGKIVADSLADYLGRHRHMAERLSRNGLRRFFTTDDPAAFNEAGARFYGAAVQAEYTSL